MGLSAALANAFQGLSVTQSGISLTSSNIANAETPGYVRKTLNRVERDFGGVGATVDVAGVNRELDVFLQRQIQTEQSGASFADLRSSILSSLQSVFGKPGDTGTLESALNSLTTAVQALSTSPDSQSVRLGIINAAQSLTRQLNSMTQGVQSLRAQAENGIATAVNSANSTLTQILGLNKQLAGVKSTDGPAATLRDQRDRAVDQLSQLMDIRVTENPDNTLSIFTSDGVQLVGADVATLSFNEQTTVTANTLWNANPLSSGLGSITVNFPGGGGSLDLVQSHSIQSGTIAAYLKLRDDTLVQAQTQLDQVAASMSSLLSDKITNAAIVPGPPTSSNLDLSNLQDGNPVHISYIDGGGVSRQLSLLRVNNPALLPLSNSATLDPNDQVIGIDFSGGLPLAPAAVAAVNARFTALGLTGLTFSGTGTPLTVTDTGALAQVTAASVTSTMTTLQNGGPELPMFVDGSGFYTGAITSTGPQSTGFAGRISVNAALVADPSKLVIFTPTTPTGDTTRPDFIYNRLTKGQSFYPPSTGFGTAATPFQSTLLSFSQQMTAAQGSAAAEAKDVADGQDVVLSTLQQKFSKTSGVDIDKEMSDLVSLQNAYAANAHVMSTVKDMFDKLLQSV